MTDKNIRMLVDDNNVIFYRIDDSTNIKFVRCISRDGRYRSVYHNVPNTISMDMIESIEWDCNIPPLKFPDINLILFLKESIKLTKIEYLNNIPFWFKSMIILYELQK